MKLKIRAIKDQKFNSDYFKMQSKDFVKKWSSIAKQNRRNKIPEQETQKQAQTEFQEARLRIDFDHELIKNQEELILEEQQQLLKDFKENFNKHVQAEKVKLSERMFKRIDRLKIPVDKLKDKIEEFKQVTSLK